MTWGWKLYLRSIRKWQREVPSNRNLIRTGQSILPILAKHPELERSISSNPETRQKPDKKLCQTATQSEKCKLFSVDIEQKLKMKISFHVNPKIKPNPQRKILLKLNSIQTHSLSPPFYSSLYLFSPFADYEQENKFLFQTTVKKYSARRKCTWNEK